MSGDGSAAKPWSTLADVVNPANKLISTQSYAGAAYRNGTDTALHAVNPTGPVKAGDLILLKSGNHGTPSISSMFNSDFITVAAGPGETPVLTGLSIVSSGKWMFQGVKFQAVDPAGASKGVDQLVGLGRGDWNGTTSDIVLDSDSFSTVDSTTGWASSDWYAKPYNNTVAISAPCTTITAGHIYNVINGVAIGAQKTLVQGNTIEYFSNDAIDTSVSNVLIKGNTIRNGTNNTSDPLHADGIQGWSATVNGVVATNTNVVIDGNTLTKTGDANSTYMQGISIFDGKWSGLVIQNNVVDVNHWNALAVYGAVNSKILDNTVIASDPTGHPSWIQVHNAKDGTASSNVLVRNNIATQFDIGTGATFDHNIAAATITTYPNGTRSIVTSGTVGTANSVLPAVLTGFTTLNPTAGIFDMRLRPTSPAVGFGTLSGAATLDILGRTRTSPVDAGAYNH